MIGTAFTSTPAALTCRDTPIASRLLLRLHALPNVLISPHTAYYTDHALRDTVANSLTNCVNRHG